VVLRYLVQQPFEGAAAQEYHRQRRIVVEADLDLLKSVSDDRLEVDRDVDAREIQRTEVLGEKHSFIPGEAILRLQHLSQLRDGPFTKQAIRFGLLLVPGSGVLPEFLHQESVLKHVDGQLGEIRVGQYCPQVTQHPCLRLVAEAVRVDADAVADKVGEGGVGEIQDVPAAHLQQVLKCQLQLVIDSRHINSWDRSRVWQVDRQRGPRPALILVRLTASGFSSAGHHGRLYRPTTCLQSSALNDRRSTPTSGEAVDRRRQEEAAGGGV